jgi:hypothetical protein
LNLLFLPSFVFRPALLSRRDVLPLSFFGAAADQNYQLFAILAEIDAKAWTEVDPVFKDAGPDTFHSGEIPLFHAGKRYGHSGSRIGIEVFQPLRESFVSVFVNVATNLNRQ